MSFVCSAALASVTSLSPYSFDRSAEVDAIMIMIMIRMIMMVIRNTMMAVERNYDPAEYVVKFTLGGGGGGIPSKLEFHHSSKTKKQEYGNCCHSQYNKDTIPIPFPI